MSVDTWRAPVARAALAAGAAMVNDVSGLSDPDLAGACADSGAGARDNPHSHPPEGQGLSRLRRRGRGRDRLSRPSAPRPRAGPACRASSWCSTRASTWPRRPAQSVELLRRLPELAALGRPLLVAVSRKDFVGALTGRPPAGRLAGTLAALGAAVDGGAAILRVHDVAEARDYLAVRAALNGDAAVDGGTSGWTSTCAGRPCEAVHDRPALRPALWLSPLRAQPAGPGPGRGQRAGAGGGDHLRGPHRRRPAGRVPAGGGVPVAHRLRADHRHSRQPRLAQRRLRPLRGAVRASAARSSTTMASRSWRSTPPSPTSITA